ncbi:hypothetical protein RDI58_023525 [Solanum bulbocastanum]|uniref:Uncharacterized protein n=1 Tax=Solanum bulbocastanum TaxID=147425 RepID=A0AAN8TCQ5_SOLBU
MSRSSGPLSASSFQSKEFKSEPNITGTILNASGKPGHILRPAPNGIKSKSCPRISKSEPQNLSGLNTKGSSQKVKSLPIDHTLTSTCE